MQTLVAKKSICEISVRRSVLTQNKLPNHAWNSHEMYHRLSDGPTKLLSINAVGFICSPALAMDVTECQFLLASYVYQVRVY